MPTLLSFFGSHCLLESKKGDSKGLQCPILVGTSVRAVVPWSVGRKMSRRARLWMPPLQDPWALLQQSVAWNGSAIVGEKGNSSLANKQKKVAAPWDHCLPDRFRSWQGPTQRSLFRKKTGRKWACVVAFAQCSDTVHLFKQRIWMIFETKKKNCNNKGIYEAVWRLKF